MKRKIIISVIAFMFIGFAQAQKNGAQLFNDHLLHEIRFENTDTNIYINSKNYQQVKMYFDGSLVDSVGFKRKGNISGYPSTNKYGIKIKTNKYVQGKKYDGIKEFTLHMNFQDPTMLREKLSYDICMNMGLYSLRTAFAKVYINDIYWGLFTIVEGKDEMYKQVFDHRDMDAIESLDFGNMCFISQNPSDYDYEQNGGNPTYVLENGEPTTAWDRFALMIDKVNNTPDIQYLDTASVYLNLEGFFKYQAINVYLMNMDSYISFLGNQIYVYDELEKLWQVTPWDFNASFGLWNTNNFSPNSYPILPNSIAQGCIATKINDFELFQQYYYDAMCELNYTVGDTQEYFNRIDDLKNQIKQAVYEDTRKVISNDDFDQGIEYGYHELFGENQPALKTFITERFELIQNGLNNIGYHCTTATNELNHKNLSVYPNPASHFIQLGSPIDNEQGMQLEIYNSYGQVVYSEKYKGSSVSISSLSTGVYVLVLKSENEKWQTKLIKN